MALEVITEPGEQSGNVSHIPSLPGCWSQGATSEESFANILEAAEIYLDAYHGASIME
jgi:predicted RNase H-like HicB family nuclease